MSKVCIPKKFHENKSRTKEEKIPPICYKEETQNQIKNVYIIDSLLGTGNQYLSLSVKNDKSNVLRNK